MSKRDLNNLENLPDRSRPRNTFHEGESAMLRKRVFKRIGRLNVEKLRRRGLDRGRKWLQLRRMPQAKDEKRPVFIVGCNRSGTNMVCGGVGNSPYGWDYRESAMSLAFKGYYLREDRIIDWLISATPAPVISFGSILDSQSTDRLLSRFKNSRAIWVYRRYGDVANSCARMQWGSHLKDLARWVARGELDRLGARGKRISADTVRLFGELFNESLSKEDSACLYWYMRNQLYFNLDLQSDPCVLIVQYEDTVLNKERAFRRIFDFLEYPYDPVVIEDIFASSVGKHSWPGIDPAIQEACNALLARLDMQYASTSDWTQEDRSPIQVEREMEPKGIG